MNYVPPAGESTGEDVLRFAFVEMMFALAVGQVAIHAADVLSITASLWDKTPALFHLGVGLVLIAASWVGWRQSVSPGIKEEKVKYVISIAFVGLLIDVLLVILYFILVRNVEIEQRGGNPSLTAATAAPESFWLFVVFVVYAIWDLVADVFSPGCIPPQRSRKNRRKNSRIRKLLKVPRAMFVSAYTSVVCGVLSYMVYGDATTRKEAWAVLFLDGALVCVILLFRVLKASENIMAQHLKVTDCKAFKTPRETKGSELWWGIALFVLYIVCLLLAAYAFNLAET